MSLPESLERAASELGGLADQIRPANGDPHRLLEELNAHGATICMVTHDPRYAEFAQRSVHLFDGRVVDEETIRQLREEEDVRLREVIDKARQSARAANA